MRATLEAEHTSEPVMQGPARHAWVAVLLSGCAFGLGHLYAGRARMALGWAAASVATYVALAVIVSLFGADLEALAVVISQSWVLSVACMASAAMVSRAAERPYVLRTYNHWTTYVVWFVAVAGLTEGASQLVRAHALEAYSFPSRSMLPTIADGDHVFSNKTIRGADAATPGRIVHLRLSRESLRPSRGSHDQRSFPCLDSSEFEREREVISRIVAVGGQSVEYRNAMLLIDGAPVRRERVPLDAADDATAVVERETLSNGASYQIQHHEEPRLFAEYEVPAGHVFVLGDNRDIAADSRCWGPVAVDNLSGVVERVWWSVSPDFTIRWERFGLPLE